MCPTLLLDLRPEAGYTFPPFWDCIRIEQQIFYCECFSLHSHTFLVQTFHLYVSDKLDVKNMNIYFQFILQSIQIFNDIYMRTISGGIMTVQ